MGRYVRPVLRDLATRPDIELTLLVRDVRAAADYRAIVGSRASVAPLAQARAARRFDRIWYPWNGMRFEARAPALVTINDDFAFAYPARGLVARLREQAPVRRAVRRAARIATISGWSRDALAARFGLPPDRITVLPLTPDAYFTPGFEPSPRNEPFVLSVGTGEARKNVAFLIDAFTDAFPRGDVRLVIVGQPDPGLRARSAASGVPIEFVARIDDAALRRFYRTAAAVAVPSLAEGFGLVAAEAQACAAAVIAARASALPEAVGDAGLLVDPRDRAGWRDGLRALVGDLALRARYGSLGAARWAGISARRTSDSLIAALECAIDDRV